MTEQELEERVAAQILALTQNQTRGERAADWITTKIGSWPFIIGQNLAIFAWCSVNSYLVLGRAALDPFPWILLNLMLSLQAAQTGPIVLIASNRQEKLLWALLQNMLILVTAVSRQVGIIVRNDERMGTMMELLVKHAKKGEKRDEDVASLLHRITEYHDAARKRDETTHALLRRLLAKVGDTEFDAASLK